MVNTKKLFKTALEGVVSSSLVATVMLTQLNLSVKAVTPTKPSDGMFIEKAKLRDGTYGLSSGKKVQKVYFGHNPHFNKVTGTRSTASDPIHLESGAAPAEQGWFIAGSQATGYGADGTNGGFVLLCDPLQPMIDATVTDTYGGMPFLAEGKYEGSGETGTFNKTGYSQSWGCTYEGDAPAEGSQVYANHFGGSDIWKKIKEYQVQEARWKIQPAGHMIVKTVNITAQPVSSIWVWGNIVMEKAIKTSIILWSVRTKSSVAAITMPQTMV